MDERTRLIQDLDSAREVMRAVLAEIDPEREVYPGWTIKEVLAHVAGWDDAAMSSLRAHARGEIPQALAVEGINAYNATTVSTREALNLDQIVQEWEFSRRELKAVIQEMPDGQLDTPMLFPWGGRGTTAQLVDIFAGHERSHAAEIRKMLT